MSMALLWRDQGKQHRALDLLAQVYGWFTEGFDTLDPKEAKALLACRIIPRLPKWHECEVARRQVDFDTGAIPDILRPSPIYPWRAKFIFTALHIRYKLSLSVSVATAQLCNNA